MATVHEAVIITKWTEDAQGNRPHFADSISFAAGEAWVDALALPADPVTGRVIHVPNVNIVAVRCGNATATALNNFTGIIVLARRSYDDTVVEGQSLGTFIDYLSGQNNEAIVTTFNNFTDVPTLTQINNLVTALKNRFPDVLDAHIEDAGQAAFQQGLTRLQIIRRLVLRWRKLARA